jgi:hypothetical protein
MNFQKFTTFKTIFIALVLTINANQLFAQTTNGIFFQAVARDNFSNPAKDRKIYVQSSIIQTTPTGIKVLTEEHQANTDATGVFSISLGNGVRVGGTASNLTTIDWSKGPFYLNLKVAITPIGGNSNWDYNKEWVDMGTTSFGAVPFALYSASSAKVDDKLNATDTTKMLSVYAKAIKVQSLETAVASKLTAADTLTMLAPYAKAAYTIDSSFFKSQLATKLSLSDTINYTKQKYTDSAIAKKLNIADSSIYVTKSQLASYNFSSGGTTTTTTSVTMDTTSLSNRINLKAAASDLINLNTTVTSNTASITANTSSISSLTNNITSNTASITANATAINLKAPVASPLFTGTVGIGTTNPSSAAALDITSTTQGLLLPRLTYVQKTAISNPVAGLILFCSDCGTSGEMQLYNGTSFVNMIGGTAQLALPVISSTTGAYSITTSSAISGGVITSDGGASITARGLVWGTSAGSTTYSITTGTGTGTFTSSITGLTSGITYYIRAFATNSVGTKYGSEITLNTAQAVATLAATTTVSDISSTTATSGGNITYNGGATVTASGVVWSTTSTPTIALATKTTNGAVSGTYTSNITGLTPGTLYYVRSYATNSVGISYGAQTSFTTLNTATIAATVSATSITSNTATTGGDITADGGATVTSRGLVYGTSAGSATFSVTSGTGTGTYSIGLTGLTPATTYYVRSFATNSVGTVYGTEKSFTTIAIAPTLTTTAASSVTKYAANTGGTIISNGGSTITTSGICWSTTATPTISDSKTTDGTTSGTFTSSLTSLTAGTTYYVRSYATNAIGTGYGPNESFTTLSTSSNNPALDATTTATSITANSAILGGNVTDEGATQVSVRGLVYGTTTGSATYSVTVGSGAGTFTSTLTGLAQGTKYFVRSFATNVQGTSYGAETSFTTQTTATLSATATPTSITTTSAISGGTISSTGGATITTSGLVWGASTNPTIALSTKTTDGTTTGTYTSSITGLTQGATYHVRAYATNYLGTSYGPNITFTTLTTPTISATASAISITSSIATIGGEITSDGGAAVTARGVVYGTTTGSATYSVTSGTGTGTYTIGLTGLTPATTYFVRSFATNSVGTVYGTETNFSTLAIAPTLTTSAVSGITKYAASAGGTITFNGGSVITASGICWSTTSTPTTSNSKTTDGTTSGTFTSSVTGLTAGTTYYVRAYATNAIGTSYGAAQSFTTTASESIMTLPTVGSSYGGGKVAYVYQNGDPGYSSSSIPVLIAANADQVGNLGGGTALWSISGASGIAQKVGLIGTSYQALGAGLSNTNAIISAYGTGNYAAKFAKNYTDGTYNDWYLPSIDELGKLYLNRVAIGGFTTQYYWSSTEVEETPTQIAGYSWSFSGAGNDKHMDTKAWNMKIRAVRTTTLTPVAISNPVIASTTSATSITTNSAILGGNVTEEGATQVSVRGLVYGTTTGASTFSVTVGSGGGTFTGTLTGLSQGTTYFARSFATNVQGTSYGAETSFTTQTTPTVSVTLTPTSITTTTAIGGGTISSTGGATITTSGLVWGASTNPEITLTTKTTNGATSGTFTSSITGLTQGTTYHVRAYATNYLGTTYGPNITFTTITTPTVSSTATVTSITGSTATSGGTISLDGGATVTSRGLVYGTSSLSSTFSVTSGTGTGTYSIGLTGLTPATTYYVRSFATNSVGTVYGTETNFTTIAVEPTVSATAVAASITGSSATSGGTISSNGGSTVTVSGIVWSTTSTPTIALSTKTTNGAATGTYTSSITGLAPATLYYVRAYANNSIGTAYGPQNNFTTLAIAPTISATATVTSITGSTATSGGTITVDGGATVTSRGVVWGTTTGSSTYSSTSGTGTGTYLSNLSGLSIATTYFVRAFATNSAGTAYGPEVQFATPNTATLASTITSTITSSTAILGGVLTSTGGATTSIGIMYSTSSSFATYSTTTINANAVAGTYTTSILGLSELTTYYVKAFATNTAGTTYGPTINFSTPVLPLTVGTTYQGGIIFYLFQSGDPGYVAGQTHGLIASTSDLSTYTDWKNNGGFTNIATGTGLGTGLANTNAIIASHGSSATYAAGRARAHNGGGYTDWYLPSRDELYKMHISIGQGANNIANMRSETYWSSSQSDSMQAYYMFAQSGNIQTVWKDWGKAVRAIRTF